MEGTVCRRCTCVAGARPYGLGHMAGAQYTTVSGQVNLAHAPPTVRTSAWEESETLSQARINCAANCMLFSVPCSCRRTQSRYIFFVITQHWDFLILIWLLLVIVLFAV
jgi:hypothetical protein